MKTLGLREYALMAENANSSIARLYGNGSDVTARGSIVPEVTPCILWQRK